MTSTLECASTSSSHPNGTRRPTYMYTLEQLVRECGESPNPYLNDFAGSQLAELFQTNEPIAQCFGHLSGSKIRKELLEAAAMESRLKRVVDITNSDRPVVVWDMCCGKGFSSLWLACNTFASNPSRVQVHMTDRNQKMNWSWLEQNKELFGHSCCNISFHCQDLYSKELEDLIRDSVCTSTQGESPILIFVAIHTCGDLSRRVLELGSICGAHATIVSPCCCVRLVKPPKRPKGSFGYDTPIKARKFNGMVTVYQLWCWMLWGYAQSQSPKNDDNYRNKIDLASETLMKTDKNMWLTVVNTAKAAI